MTLGDLKNAVTAYLRSGDLISAAETCETLAGAHPNEADHWLQEAVKHFSKAKQPVRGFELLLQNPRLQPTFPHQVLQPSFVAFRLPCF